MNKASFEDHDIFLFLAMCWSGGGTFQLKDLIFAYDWVNRAVLSAQEMEGALNRLLSAGLVNATGNSYAVPKAIFDEFDAFRKRRRKDRFEVASAFVKRHEPLSNVEQKIRIPESNYRKAYDAYSR